MMDIQAMIWIIIYGAGAGAGYALLFFVRAVQAGAESFDFMKFARALVIGALVGGFSAFSGIPLSEANYETQVLAYGFITVFVDQIIKMLWRKAKAPTPP